MTNISYYLNIVYSIHPRDKQDVAKRLALAGRAVAYNENNLDFQGPIPTDLTLNGNRLVIEFDHGNSAIEVRKTDGFEVRLINMYLKSNLLIVHSLVIF